MDLTVAEVIAAIDGPLGMTECAGEVDHEVCTHMSYCVARPHWARVTLVVQAALGAVTIEDMMAPPFTVAASMSRNVSPLAQGAEAS